MFHSAKLALSYFFSFFVLLSAVDAAQIGSCTPQPAQLLRMQEIASGAGQHSQVVAVQNSSRAFATYHDETRDSLISAYCSDALCAETPVSRELDVGDPGNPKGVGRMQKMTIGYDGFPVISYDGAKSLKVAHCKRSDCSDSELAELPEPAVYTSIAIAEDGNPVVAYYHKTEHRLRYVRCRSQSCQQWENPISLDDSGLESGMYPAIHVDSRGRPVIAYFVATASKNNELRVAYCSDASCQTVNITALDSQVVNGAYSSMVLAADDSVSVMYVDEDRQQLRVAHCPTPGCADGRAVITVVDTIAGAHTCAPGTDKCPYGVFPTIVLGPCGLPVMTYYNETSTTSGALKLAQCLTNDCTRSLVQDIASGLDGFGRDSMIAFDATGGNAFISFLDYHGSGGSAMLAKLAVLSFTSSSVSDTDLVQQ